MWSQQLPKLALAAQLGPVGTAFLFAAACFVRLLAVSWLSCRSPAVSRPAGGLVGHPF